MKPSLLAVTSELPWPLSSGGRLRTYHLLKELTSEFSVRLVAGVERRHQPDLDAIADAGIAVRAVELSSRSPVAESGRLLSSLVAREPYAMYRRHDRPEIRRALMSEAATARPDVLYLDHLDSFLFADVAKGALVALDLHNVYSLLIQRESTNALNNWLTRRFLSREAILLERIESQAVRQADVVFSVSEEEQSHFARIRGRDVHLLPNGVNTARFAGLPTGRIGAPPTILFVGSLSWRPNVKTVHYLATDVLPAVRRHVPGARLTVVGRDPGPDVLALTRDDAVTVAGNVADIVPCFRDAAVLAVPLEAGGGTRLKILESFAAGLPVVSTAIGAEGLAAADGRELTLAELPEFADAVVRLLSHPDLAAAQAARARTLVRERYDWPIVGAAARTALQAALQQRQGTRGRVAS